MTPARKPLAAGDRAGAARPDELHRSPGRAAPLLEWLVGGLGAVLVGGAIAFLAYHALTRDRSPPDVRVVVERVLELDNGYLVQFRAFNQGGSPAAQLTIEGEVAGPDGSAEASEAVLDYLPARSDRAGGLVFSRDPRAGQLSLRATGYAEP
jgi:uncharacterized protein (TIGR02588 family)